MGRDISRSLFFRSGEEVREEVRERKSRKSWKGEREGVVREDSKNLVPSMRKKTDFTGRGELEKPFEK